MCASAKFKINRINVKILPPICINALYISALNEYQCFDYLTSSAFLFCFFMEVNLAKLLCLIL